MKGKRKERTHPIVGKEYKKTYKEKNFILKVIDDQGSILFKLQGKVFKTPTAAAKSITRYEVNGWVFWGIDNDLR